MRERWTRFTGLPMQVIEQPEAAGYLGKLDLDKHCRGPVIHGDVDWWLLRWMDLRSWDGTWMAVQDPGVHDPLAFPQHDCERHGLDKARYFNSGFFCCDLSRPDHREVFRLARCIESEVHFGKREPVGDFGEQTFLNMAMQILGVPCVMLPNKYNFYKLASDWGNVTSIPRDIIGLHAAGVPLKQKLRTLRMQAEVFGSDVGPMNQSAIQQQFTRTFELS